MNVNPTETYAGLHEELARRVSSFNGEIGLYFEDLTTGAGIGINDGAPFLAGSTIKVPLVLYLYTLAREGEIDLDEHATIRWEDLEEGTGFVRLHGHGSRWTLRELAGATLSASDNTAANTLFRLLGRAYLYRFMKQTGGEVIPTGPAMDNTTSPRDLGRYFKALLKIEEGFPGAGGEPLRFLSRTPYDDRITAYLPWDIRVAHKTGNFEYMVADAGIVYLPGRPYILSVFVHYGEEVDDYDEAEEDAAAAIADISFIVYRFQSALAARAPGGLP